MSDHAGLPPRAFDKADASPDPLFYAHPRLVTHIDDGAIAAVTTLYRRLLPPGGDVLDLMSSWVSHLPSEVRYGHVTGHGMNPVELAANRRLDAWFVQDLNAVPVLPLPDRRFDAACLCVSVQYLQRPVAVFREALRVLRPGAPLVVSFSNRCFPTKAVAIWQALPGTDQQQLVSLYLSRAGFGSIETSDWLPAAGDPLWAAIGAGAGKLERRTRHPATSHRLPRSAVWISKDRPCPTPPFSTSTAPWSTRSTSMRWLGMRHSPSSVTT